jgi:hypothetical protein
MEISMQGGCQGDVMSGARDCYGDAVGYRLAGVALGKVVECWVGPGFAGHVQEGGALLAALQGGFGAAAEGGG